MGEQAELPFEADANFEQLGYLLAMAIKGGVTPSGPTDSLYTWTFKPNLGAANDVDSFTFQYGDDVQAFISSWVFGTDLELSGSLTGDGEPLMVKSNLVGQNVRTAAFTGGLSNPSSLTPVKMGKSKLYVDSAWANLGDTEVSNTLVDLSYKVAPGLTPVKFGNGELFYTDVAEKKRHVELDITFAFNPGVAGYFANYIATPQTPIFARVKFEGPTVGETAKAELDLDGHFVIDDYGPLDDREGQDIVKLKLVSLQDEAVSGNEWQILLLNGLP